MTNTTALRALYDNLSAEARATILFTIDTELRNNISDEEVFERWLMCGIPDGCETAQAVMEAMETAEMEAEEFEDLLLLAASCFDEDNEEEWD